MAKANKIVEQNSDELAKSIGQTSNELQKLVKEGKSSTDEFKKLSGTLKEQIDIYEKTKQEIDEMVKVTAKYVTLLDNIASGHTNVSKAVKQAKEDIQKLTLAGKENTFEFEAATTTLKKLEKITSKDSSVSMRSGIRATREELAKMLLSGEANTDQLYEMAKAGGELSSSMGDASQAISVMASNTFPLDSMLQGVQSITEGFQVAEGAMALFGVENEDLQKTLVKLNALMAITSGLQQLQNSLQKTSALSLGFNVVMQKACTLAVGESTGAMKSKEGTF